MLTYDTILQSFLTWAESEPGLRAAVMIGSRARTDHPADEWSDLDMLLFVTNLEHYVYKTDWLEKFGSVWVTFLEHTPDDGSPERRVMYAGGLDVDFVLNPVDALAYMLAHDLPAEIVDVLRRGSRLLVDKDGDLEKLLRKPLPEISLYHQPAESDFLNGINNFWYHTVWTAKHLRRGEIWWAKNCCDGYLKDHLRQMLEWHAHALKGSQHDTWMRGRFLEQWADPRAVAALKDTYAHYDRDDIARALLATMDLFRWLAKETAARWGYSYPYEGDRQTTGLVKDLLATGG